MEEGENQLKLVNCTFAENFAFIQGGGLHWSFVPPLLLNNTRFLGNLAGVYGDNVSSYPIGLVYVPLKQISNITYATEYSTIEAAIMDWCPLRRDDWSKTNFVLSL
jgi:hypothetical protein